jgi:hypothetical protein
MTFLDHLPQEPPLSSWYVQMMMPVSTNEVPIELSEL